MKFIEIKDNYNYDEACKKATYELYNKIKFQVSATFMKMVLFLLLLIMVNFIFNVM